MTEPIKLHKLVEQNYQEMTQDSDQLLVVTNEYLTELMKNDPIQCNKLTEALKDSNYRERFIKALIETSIVTVVLAFAITQQPHEQILIYDDEDIKLQFLANAANDDDYIQNMRVFYLSGITPEDLGIYYSEDISRISRELNINDAINEDSVNRMARRYKKSIAELLNEYKGLFSI